MKNTILKIIGLFIVAGIAFALHDAITKTEIQTCKEYVDDALNIHNWFISKADYEMCKYYGIDFSEYLK